MAKKYQLAFSKEFAKDFKKLPPHEKPRVKKALLLIKQDPYSARNLKKLTNVNIGQYRFRIGVLRIRFDIEGDTIQLLMVRHRKDVYRKNRNEHIQKTADR